MNQFLKYETGSVVVDEVTRNETGKLRITDFEDVDGFMTDLHTVERFLANKCAERVHVEIEPFDRTYGFLNVGEVHAFMLGFNFCETTTEVEPSS